MPTRTARTAWKGTLDDRLRPDRAHQLEGGHLRCLVPEARGRRGRRDDQPRGTHRRRPLVLLRHAVLRRARAGRWHAASLEVRPT